MAAKAREEAKALVKGLDVIETLAGARRELTLTELTRALNLPKATAHRIVKVLKGRRYLEQDTTTNAYRLGLKVWEIGHQVVNQRRLREVARPFLEALARKTEEHVNLAVFDGTDAVFIEIIESAKPIRFYAHMGGRVPAHCSATGKVILAWQPEETINDVIKAGLKPFTARTIVQPGRLCEELRSVRARGYALNLEEWREDVCGLGAPVWNHENRVVASISITTPASRFDDEALRPLVIAAARGVSRELGWIEREAGDASTAGVHRGGRMSRIAGMPGRPYRSGGRSR
jgi:DNA-binding IclR family transcriptional regulator